MTSHLREDRLFDCYLSNRLGEALDHRAADHLASCPTCASRYDDLSRFLDGLRVAEEAEFEAVFSADHLREQQRQIAKRLELVGRAARVLSFPHAATARRRPSTRWVFPRWVATTAAAGVVAGVAAGMFFERAGRWDRRARISSFANVGVTQLAPPSPTPDDSTDVEQDAIFLSELELAADGPRTQELAAYDELTPQVREVSFTVPDR
ncbi:MAG: hypothetical protein FJW27_00560 [Acidimicrobiia bacterium]|nr:hypothetical protein [Acidimicrobiia bacterium]